MITVLSLIYLLGERVICFGSVCMNASRKKIESNKKEQD